MSYIAICDYENYYNRRCLPPQDTFQDYDNYIIDIFEDINFKINDGINTEQVINWKQPSWAFPNYLLVSDDGDTIKSRWYVLESQQTRSGQLKLTLRRDLIADFYEEAINAPAMIERGRLSAYDPYIFNDEGIRFNQIKTDEYLLKDETQIPWIVGYVANYDQTEDDVITFPSGREIYYDETYTSLSSWYYNAYVGESVAVSSDMSYIYKINSTIGAKNGIANRIWNYNTNTNTLTETRTDTVDTGLITPPATRINQEYLEQLNQAFEDTSYINASEFVPRQAGAVINTLRSYNNKILRIGSPDSFTYYRVLLMTEDEATIDVPPINVPTSGNYWTTMSRFISENQDLISGTPLAGEAFGVSVNYKKTWLALEKLDLTLEVKIPKDRNILTDAPYSMFAIPYGEIGITGYSVDAGKVADLTIDKTQGAETASLIARQISKQLTGAKVYDIQLLPYCPVRNFIYGTNRLNMSRTTINKAYSNVYDASDRLVSILLWADVSEFTFDINRLELNPYDVKTTNQCITRRLCSPNYSAIYEFNDAKLKGIQGFNIDCAYKPYTPYIHIWPKGGNGSLYGADFNDPRGLICSGDFSMSATQDQWQLYELNNKNYQNMFDRQIETMDLTHDIQKEQQIWQLATGALGATSSGFGVGTMMSGNPLIGAGVGAVAGTVSIVAGARDMVLQDQLRENERSQAYDMFRMSNENIQAMPDTLTKVSAFNPNNKIFPVMETYSATEKEISAFQDYIKYRGMTVGRIGTVAEFIWPTEEFIQARIIRFDTLHDDAHVANEINNELMRGVYMKQ